MGLVFYGNSDDDLCRIIEETHNTLVYYAPGVSVKLAKALCNTLVRGVQLRIMLDFTPASVKSGYWEKPALGFFAEALKQDDAQHEFLFAFPGIRLGIIQADDVSYVFTPKVYGRKHHEEWEDFPNRLQVTLPYPDDFGGRSLYTKLMEFSDLEQFASQAELLEIDANKAEEEALAELPPGVLPCYDFLQKVELKVSNFNILEFSLRLDPNDILPDYPEQAKRLQATYKLFEKEDQLELEINDPTTCQIIAKIEHFNADLNGLKKTYLKNLGAPYGNVIVSNDVPKFREKVQQWAENIKNFAPQMKTVFQSLVYKRLIDILEKLPRYQQKFVPGKVKEYVAKNFDVEKHIYEMEKRFNPKVTLSISLFTPEIWGKKDFQESVEKVFQKHFNYLLTTWKEEAALMKAKKESGAGGQTEEDNV